MNKPEFAPQQLKGTKTWEYAVRFAFGGSITVGTGLVAKVWGPLIAGLFLAFPAILPASMTFVKRHDGREKATDDARGARLGSVGLTAFALVVLLAVDHAAAPIVLALAAIAWVAVDVTLWFMRYGSSAA